MVTPFLTDNPFPKGKGYSVHFILYHRTLGANVTRYKSGISALGEATNYARKLQEDKEKVCSCDTFITLD